MKQFWLIIGLVWMLAGCGSSGNDDGGPIIVIPTPDKNPNKPAMKYSNTGDKYLPGVRAVVAQIHDYLDTLPDCNGDLAGMENADLCDTTEYSIQDTLFPSTRNTQTTRASATHPITVSSESTRSTSDSGVPQILIIDSGVESAALRYQQRMLAMYEWVTTKDNGVVHSGYRNTTATVKTSPASFHIRAAILGQSDAFVPSTELTRELDRQKFTKLPSDPGDIVHGAVTLNLLADYIPEAQFVTLASLSEIVFPDDVACSFDGAVIDNYVNDAINTLNSIIRRHGIDYINLSAGLTSQNINQKLYDDCGVTATEQDIVRLHVAYGKILAAMADKAILVQAAPNSTGYPVTTSKDGRSSHSTYYSDCMEIGKRLRTGYFAQSYRGENDGALPILPSEGAGYSSGYDELFLSSQLAFKGCVDGYFNTGWRDGLADLPSFGDYPILYSQDGLAAGPMSFLTTSFINGVGIAYIEYIARDKGLSRPAALQAVKERKVNVDTPWLMDPMRYAEMPVCIDFPEACENWDSFTYEP
ncbi:hypothetical protein [Gynuella sp.]|uniref:hypothetical protein n=1 Tax=Gynuella sp. TaxID=2969146 RepID=UPI003D0E4BE3